eukprot:GGOE01042588.1.p1 GENE.GGOE01042588.1~~GGOE01042588.1.p1  ORF type:complete len:738 (-),score=237.65 GGOE01042588.1:378-2321(-)
MVELCMQGCSSACIGYGAAAAGKTHTLFGSEQEHGLIQMTTKELFECIEAEPPNITYRVVFTYWEMNSHEIRDALDISNTTNLAVRKNPKDGSPFVAGLKEVEVSNWEELDDWIMRGNVTRIALSEERNARWHGFLRLHLTRLDAEDPDHVSTATMLFAHLKGSDRFGKKGARGEALKQGSSVNKSISLLGSAMLHAVDMRRRKVNEAIAQTAKMEEAVAKRKLQEVQRAAAKESSAFFGDCKLTQILADPLGGSCGTFLLATASTLDYHETTDILENLQNAQQLLVHLKRNIETTPAGYVHKELERIRCLVPETGHAMGHPLSEVQEAVRKLEQQYGALLRGQERPDTPEESHEPPPLRVLPSGPRWRQANELAEKHGDHATVFLPCNTGKATYKGHWAGGLKEGYGEQVSKLSRYIGHWKAGLRHGDGTLWVRRSEKEEWTRVYRGGWKADKRHGYGSNWYPNGDIYEGYWADGQRCGIGKLFLVNGDKVEGQWRNDKSEGWASHFLHNGDWFEGHWRNGVREGPGVWYYESKAQLYRGEWHMGSAKCGTIEDMPRKTAAEDRHYLPRCRVINPEGVLQVVRSQLKDRRFKMGEAAGSDSQQRLEFEDFADEVPEEPHLTHLPVETREVPYQNEIEEYIECMAAV